MTIQSDYCDMRADTDGKKGWSTSKGGFMSGYGDTLSYLAKIKHKTENLGHAVYCSVHLPILNIV